MKILVDTNLFLDVLLEREGSQYAQKVFQSIQEGLFEAFVADITLLNIDYIARKQQADIKIFLDYVLEHFIVLGADNSMFKDALILKNRDLEDNIQYLLAKRASCEMIITNDRSFIDLDAEVISSHLFVQHHCL